MRPLEINLDEVLTMGIGALIERDTRELVHSLTKKRVLTRNCLCWHLDLGLLASKTVRK
jgi:hypothetical protein